MVTKSYLDKRHDDNQKTRNQSAGKRMWAFFLVIGGLIGSVFYGFFWVIKFSFMFIYKMFKYMALGTAYVVKRILDLPHGWAILAGVVIILALIQAFSS